MSADEARDPRRPYTDRSARLRISGVLSVLAGGLCLILGLLQFVLLAVQRWAVGLEGLGVDRRSALSGFLLYGSLAVPFVWVGVGSIRRRRWAPPLMLLLATTWLLGGLMALAVAWIALDTVLAESEVAGAPGLAWAIRPIVLGLVAALGVAAPALLIWVYRDPDLLRTCEAHDLRPAWTERCPLSVLALSLGLGAGAVLALPMLPQAVVPLFGRLIGGGPGALLLVAAAAVSGYLAWATFRLRLDGYWGTLVLFVASGLSMAVTFLRVDVLDYYRAMGYPQEQLDLLPMPGRPAAVGFVAAMTLLSVVYMVAIRRHFVSGIRS